MSHADDVATDGEAHEVIIVGSGFSGLGVAALLDRAGIGSFQILETADDLGGTWRENTYPGCGCDIPSPLYSYSFDQKPDWSRLFGTQPEILAYLRDVATRRGLLDRIRFGQEVREARWSEARGQWEVVTASGQRYRARFLINAVGPLHHPSYPDIPGIESFGGPVFHSATWRHDVDLKDKRVAVIGTGASAIQFVPAIADRVAELTIFQRTAPWIVPKADRPFDDRHRRLMRFVPPYRWWVRSRLFWAHEKRAAGFVTDPAGMAKTETLARRLIDKQVRDPRLRDLVVPDYTVGCKRLLISSEWYPTLDKPQVTLRSGGVAQVAPQLLIGTDGSQTAADVVIFGTGFDSQNTVRIKVTGREGQTLAQAWADGNQAYLGTTVAGFPNMFVMVGPNTALGHNSQVFMIESQARYIVDVVRRLRRRRDRCFEVRAQVQHEFNDWLDSKLAGTVWQTGGCRSWYQDPRSGRNTVLWPDTTIAFWRRTRRVRWSDFELWTAHPAPSRVSTGRE